jgi:hypothetical protein
MAQFNKYRDDDDIASEMSHTPAAAAPSRVRDELPVANHMGGGRFGRENHVINNEETRTIILTEFLSMEDLESGLVNIAIGEKQAEAFRRPFVNPETGKTTYGGNPERSQITKVVLQSYKIELPVDVGLSFKSVSGELTRRASQLKVARNGRGYPIILSRESACDYTMVKGYKDGILIYSNDAYVDQELIEKYGNVNKGDIRAGLTDHPTDSTVKLFEFKKNPLLTDLLKRHHEKLEELFEEFNYAELKHEANVLGRDTVQVPETVIAHLENEVNTHAIGKIEEGTGPLSKAAVVLESPLSADGSFKNLRKIVKGKTRLDDAGVDQCMHIKHQIDLELVVSAVIPGASAP